MDALSMILLHLFVVFASAKLVGELFDRIGQPAVIGELLVGVLIGPHALGLIGHPGPALTAVFHDAATASEALDLVYHVLAELGVVVLLFFVGLETPLRDLLRVGPRALTVAVAGVVLPFVFGYGLMTLQGEPSVQGLFVGAAMVATSVGITARVLADLGRLDTNEARIILGAAVIDDVLGLLVLSVVTAVGREGTVSPGTVVTLAVEAVLFVGLIAVIGTRLVARYHLRLSSLRIRNAPFVVAMAVCLALAALAAQIGLAAIIGAFLAGMVFADTRVELELERAALPVYELLVPFFFVFTGAMVDPRYFVDPAIAGVAAAVTGLAVIGKLIGCGLAAWGLGRREMAVIGVGMVPRGEVGLIVASAGAGIGAIPPRVFGVVVVMSVVTTLIVPPVLALLYRRGLHFPARPVDAPDGVLPEL
jgi:Kef-type K+ transport system membrane component KefB